MSDLRVPSSQRIGWIVTVAIIVAIGIFNLYQSIIGWTLSDAAAYWDAGLRLRAGEELYPPLESVEASDVYRYAPWFAFLAVPWTFLPIPVAGALWSVVLLAASAAAIWPMARDRHWLLVALFAPILVGISAVGNVHPLIIAALVLGVDRRSGPVWVGLAASLKIFPILFALVYLGRREWWRFVGAAALAALLWAPALAYDLGEYATDAGQAAMLSGIPLLYALAAGTGIGITLIWASTRMGWLAAATTVCLSLPRFFVTTQLPSWSLTDQCTGAGSKGRIQRAIKAPSHERR